ncbi:MAG TPA: RNA polymerase sigma factor, partial [Acidimicrobiia bacterium]
PRTRARGIPPFQAFLEKHRVAVYRFLIASVGPGEADDCFQETFLAALRAYPNLKHGDNLRAWVLAIATRKAIDAGRARSRRPSPVPDVREVVELSSQDPDPLMEGPVWQAVRALPPRQRVALVHRVLLDRPYAELAAAMGSSVEAARANVYQALRKLREGWQEDEED